MRPSRRPLAITLTLASALASAGCGLSSDTSSMKAPEGSTAGPHGGTAVPLPDRQGYVEVVLDRSGVKPGKAGGARLKAYFLSPDLKSPLSPPPTDVTIKAIPPEGGALTLTLVPDAGTGKTAEPGRFMSPPGNLDYDELRGEVTATVGGKSVTQNFAFR